jgi:hypothetical protein
VPLPGDRNVLTKKLTAEDRAFETTHQPPVAFVSICVTRHHAIAPASTFTSPPAQGHPSVRVCRRGLDLNLHLVPSL